MTANDPRHWSCARHRPTERVRSDHQPRTRHRPAATEAPTHSGGTVACLRRRVLPHVRRRAQAADDPPAAVPEVAAVVPRHGLQPSRCRAFWSRRHSARWASLHGLLRGRAGATTGASASAGFRRRTGAPAVAEPDRTRMTPQQGRYLEGPMLIRRSSANGVTPSTLMARSRYGEAWCELHAVRTRL